MSGTPQTAEVRVAASPGQPQVASSPRQARPHPVQVRLVSGPSLEVLVNPVATGSPLCPGLSQSVYGGSAIAQPLPQPEEVGGGSVQVQLSGRMSSQPCMTHSGVP